LLEDPPQFEVFAAVLRLSKKYDYPMFRKDCVRRLKTGYPTTLKEFDKNTNVLIDGLERTFYVFLLALAHEIGIHSILPVIYCTMVTTKREFCLPKVSHISYICEHD
jgi:hypothetical protein